MGLQIWIDRAAPRNTAAFKRDCLYHDLAPTCRLDAALASGRRSADGFISAYELELDLVPAARFAMLVQSARRDELTLVSECPIAAHTLRRYLGDLAALSADRDQELMAMSQQCAAVAERAYEARRATGASHTAAVCSSRRALRALRRPN